MTIDETSLAAMAPVPRRASPEPAALMRPGAASAASAVVDRAPRLAAPRSLLAVGAAPRLLAAAVGAAAIWAAVLLIIG